MKAISLIIYHVFGYGTEQKKRPKHLLLLPKPLDDKHSDHLRTKIIKTGQVNSFHNYNYLPIFYNNDW